ncbi:ABC transporter ATP-binding protein [Dehalococcoidia bacterium]|nr:ABC transporter ATP-binding protein [Dehalococcoidia bacterium]MCL0096988.1 ABC transporter ATP-binding protein [Dehalococcoidia bacterium]
MALNLHEDHANAMEATTAHVTLRQVSKCFGGVTAIADLTLEVNQGEFFSLLGPSGCGKTTTLRLIAGLEEPDLGTIAIGEDIVAGARWIPPEKREVGIVFQDYALFPHMTVFKNIAFGLRWCSRQELQQRVTESLHMVDLSGIAQRYPHELSGGQQQRVALARALAPGPQVILLDEPFSNLDADLRTRIRAEVKTILAGAGATVIFVTHDQEEAFFIGDRVGVMNAGRLEQVGTPEAIFHRPATPFVAQFVGIADFIVGEVQDRAIATEIGRLPLRNGVVGASTVTVMVRPDFIDIRPAADGVGVIVDRVFHGMHYLYRVRLPSGATVQCLQHHNQCYPLNTRVAMKINAGHSLVYFADGDERQDGETIVTL